MAHHELSGKQFNEFFPLLIEKPWLEDKYDALKDLIGLCTRDSQRQLLHSLLSRFVYHGDREYDLILRAIISQVFAVWRLPLGQTQFVATTLENDADGAQAVLQDLKGTLAEAQYGPNDVKCVNKLDEATSNLFTHPNVVLIDDFFGSGTTLRNRVQRLRSKFDERIQKDQRNVAYRISACVVASMEAARDQANALSIDLFAGRFLQKGITDHLAGRARFRAYKDMLMLEKAIRDDERAREFPFGFGQAEALYALKVRKNVPNSVFWWPRLSDGAARGTIFNRFERQ